MRSAQFEVRRRVAALAGRLGIIRARLTTELSQAILIQLVDNLQQVIEHFEVALSDLDRAYDEQLSKGEASAEAQRRAEALYRAAPMPCLWIDADGIILETNPAASLLLNVAEKHLLGRAFYVFVASQ